jgi:hypothetical protein
MQEGHLEVVLQHGLLNLEITATCTTYFTFSTSSLLTTSNLHSQVPPPTLNFRASCFNHLNNNLLSDVSGH